MAHIITAVSGSVADLITPKTALLSVSDKTGLIELGQQLAAMGVKLLSTGGTAKALRDAGLEVVDVSDHTGSPEIMDGRVKTLHPKIHGGLLGVRGNEKHEAEAAEHGVSWIDIVVVNLYAFEATVAKGSDFSTCIENIDIGGPSMIRSAAKNNASVCVVSSPSQYPELIAALKNENGTTLSLRRRFAAAAYTTTAAYDTAISSWFNKQVESPAANNVTRTYTKDVQLKYGCNPHQSPAFVGHLSNSKNPFSILNGTPGYINFLDAANAWQLALELRVATGLPAAASFKHVSPAGAAVAVPLDATEEEIYGVKNADLTPVALAYLRARNADPMCSFGDFAAVSDVVDAATAQILKTEVSDGIVAPGYTEEALAILKTKKSGAFIVLQADESYHAPSDEYREVFGMVLSQKRNDCVIAPANFQNGTYKCVTANNNLPDAAVVDLTVALITIKYTQSNSVGYARNGMMIGVGAGQQSRVDCVKLAARKLATWYLRQHPKVRALPFKADVKKQAKVNARVRYIEGDFSEIEYNEWLTQFESTPEPLTEDEKKDFLKTLSGVSLASDAFFPFRDSLDVAVKYGVQFIAQPGGSVQDSSVTAAADSYHMTMVHNVPRLFHH